MSRRAKLIAVARTQKNKADTRPVALHGPTRPVSLREQIAAQVRLQVRQAIPLPDDPADEDDFDDMDDEPDILSRYEDRIQQLREEILAKVKPGSAPANVPPWDVAPESAPTDAEVPRGTKE